MLLKSFYVTNGCPVLFLEIRNASTWLAVAKIQQSEYGML